MPSSLAITMTYSHLNTKDLRGTSQADYLISLDADFELREGDDVLYQEPAFPVVELARSLLVWMKGDQRGDFRFASMSFEEDGSLTVESTPDGWVFSSVFAAASSGTPVTWSEVERCSRDFVSRVVRDLLGLGLEPGRVLAL